MFGAWAGFTEAYLQADRAFAKARADKLVAECEAIHLTHAVGRALHPGDCPSCGSQEFRTWRGVSVCSYCRSAAPSRATCASNRLSDYVAMNAHYGIAAHRRALSRITSE